MMLIVLKRRYGAHAKVAESNHEPPTPHPIPSPSPILGCLLSMSSLIPLRSSVCNSNGNLADRDGPRRF